MKAFVGLLSIGLTRLGESELDKTVLFAYTVLL